MDGVLSIIIIILPSTNCAAATSGLSVYLIFGKGVIQLLLFIDSTKLWSPKVSDLISKLSIISFIFFNSSGFILSEIYPTATSVFDILPTLCISKIKCGSLILLLINAVLNTIVSTNPSCAPLNTFSLLGSSTPLEGYVLKSRTIASFHGPSIMVWPLNTAVIRLSTSLSVLASIELKAFSINSLALFILAKSSSFKLYISLRAYSKLVSFTKPSK